MNSMSIKEAVAFMWEKYPNKDQVAERQAMLEMYDALRNKTYAQTEMGQKFIYG